MISMILLTVQERVQVKSLALMCWDTGSSSAAPPRCATARAMSRSEMMPCTGCFASATTTAPMRRSARSRAASARVRSGSIVFTSEPLSVRMCATIIAPLPCDRPGAFACARVTHAPETTLPQAPMIKSELILKIAEQNPYLYEQDAADIVNAILDTVVVLL